jgi:hypothetical protein
MSPLNHKRTTSSLAPPIFRQLKDRRFPIVVVIAVVSNRVIVAAAAVVVCFLV